MSRNDQYEFPLMRLDNGKILCYPIHKSKSKTLITEVAYNGQYEFFSELLSGIILNPKSITHEYKGFDCNMDIILCLGTTKDSDRILRFAINLVNSFETQN